VHPPTASEKESNRVSEIQQVHARQVIDSRGNPTVEGRGGPGLRRGPARGGPSGASTGEFEPWSCATAASRLAARA